MQGKRLKTALLLAIVAAVLAVAGLGGLASTADAKTAAGTGATAPAPYKVGIVYSRTGLLAAYGAQYIQGLRYGLAYATKGTNAVNGRKIELTLADDGTDPVKAVSAAKDLIGKGYKILAGSASSGVALQMAPLAEQNKILFISGPAASDAVTGINKYTFRSGRQTYQDVKTSATFLRGAGRKVVVFAQDSVFGVGNYAAVNAVVGGQGHNVSRLLVPQSAQDFTPFAQQAKQANPDLLFIAWAGTTGPAMYRALTQQGVFGVSNKVVTGLPERATWQSFGEAATRIDFLSHYVPQGPKNKVNDFLVKLDEEAGPGSGHLHAGRLRRRPDDRARAHRGEGRQRRPDDLGARGLELRRPEGPAVDPPVGPRDDPADVPGEARRERQPVHAAGDRPDQGAVRRPAGAPLTANP